MATSIPVQLLLEAYRQGAFPMAVGDGTIRWFSPQPRGIIPLDERFHIPHGAKRVLRDPAWEIRIDSCFERIIRECANRPDTWIDGTIIRSYCELFRLGHAHSVEIWRDGDLAGGLYGVSLRGAFFGESMFSRVSGASKVALVRLVEMLRAGGFMLLDTQWNTSHLASFGAIDVPRVAYMRLLAESQRREARVARNDSDSESK
jgi:leucyl/phenylalanyl-tRNA--protein transferase